MPDHAFPEPPTPAIVLDLDGTLIDSVYPHVIAWAQALDEMLPRGHQRGIALAGIHRRIGMSGHLLAEQVLTEAGILPDGETARRQAVQRSIDLHEERFAETVPTLQPVPGAAELLAELERSGVPWAIATSGAAQATAQLLERIELPRPVDQIVLVTSDEVSAAKPDPHLFLAAAHLLAVPPSSCFAVGDSVWDLLAARRAGMNGVGVLCGGFSQDELTRAAPYRVYADPADLLVHLDELGIHG